VAAANWHSKRASRPNCGSEKPPAKDQPSTIGLIFISYNVRFGSFATELVKVGAGTCPLRSESDRNNAAPRMNAIAKSGPTTPASGCISCRGYQASDFNH